MKLGLSYGLLVASAPSTYWKKKPIDGANSVSPLLSGLIRYLLAQE